MLLFVIWQSVSGYFSRADSNWWCWDCHCLPITACCYSFKVEEETRYFLWQKLHVKNGRVDVVILHTCSVFTFADIHFTQYMGAFYAKVMAAGLVQDGFCTIDSAEVLSNVERLHADEAAETAKRTLAADGLVSMQAAGGSQKCELGPAIFWTLANTCEVTCSW